MSENVTEIEKSSNITELKIISNEHKFVWNFADIKQNLNSHIEKYVGLVVTEENLKDMESTQKEISSIRTKIDGFRKEVKKKMDEPYKVFEGEIKELLQLIEKAETPLKKQILEYESDRVAKKEAEFKLFAQTTATDMGVRDEYFKITISSQWTKRTARVSTVKKEIVAEINSMLETQRRNDEALELQRQKEEMIVAVCSAHSMGLKTPVTSSDIAHLIVNAELAAIPGIILAECQKRAEMEAKAAAPKVELSPPVLDHVHHPDDNSIGFPNYGKEVEDTDPCPEWEATEIRYPNEILNPASFHIPPLPPASRPMPPMPPTTRETQYDVILKLPGVTIPQAGALKAFMSSQGISYEIISQARRSDF
ncbi:DUF1351 domain-containing protein [Pelosinus fermentans]|uniref:DUF1351 domain-containing protein n=1 Tax=Pelosinus fermentans JBW45 TaxID=1192197 RepID=I9NM64_9FIRM|nr:DUF1351 domain-containing protein [Pelosinus fermentans]AJQ26888.1 protein of unknown function DUF1351 [Pelosinus fermentans JBW45]